MNTADIRNRSLSAPARPLDGQAEELRLLLRWLGVMLIIAVALGALVSVRMAARQTALELDAARSALTRAEIHRERLLVERSLLRDPGRLADSSIVLGLVPPVATVDLREGAPQ